MRLNPTKCKEMHINFLRNSNCLINPIIIGGNVVNSVNTYKILGVIMHNDLKWNSHVDYITKKACKKLYSLRVLRRASVSQSNMLRIYLGSVRPVLEYAVPVWQDIPAYLSEAIERVQKRALNIIYPEAESYAHAVQLGNQDRLDDRRVHLCYKYMKSPSHPLHHLLPSPLLDVPNERLRQKTQKHYLFRNKQACKTKRVENFFTFKYFM